MPLEPLINQNIIRLFSECYHQVYLPVKLPPTIQVKIHTECLQIPSHKFHTGIAFFRYS